MDWLIGILSGLAFAGSVYVFVRSVFIEPHRLVVERRLLPLPQLPPALDGLTIVFLSDFHLLPDGGSVELAERAVLLANEANPDLVLLGGDLVQWCDAVPHLIPVLRRLHSRYGIFAVLGNHEHHCTWRRLRLPLWDRKPLSVQEWRNVISQSKGHLLVNEAIPLTIRGVRLWLIGVDDAYSKRADLSKALDGVPDDAFSIVLSHSPDIVDDPLIHRVALVLSGHTHGGQVVLPLLGPFLAPCRDKRRRAQGLTKVENTWLYVSRGISARLPVRFHSPPEVTVLKLTKLA